jgi:hypothetical protein
MSTPEPCPETWVLHASAQIAAQAMGLAGIGRYDTPAGCAESRPEAFAALIQAQALHRLADALAPLERIAGAMEANRARGEQPMPPVVIIDDANDPRLDGFRSTSAPQEPPQPPSATPGGHPLDQGGWIRSRVPTEGDGDVVGDVKVAIRDDSWEWCHWSRITPGQPWAPASAHPSPCTPQPLPAHIAYPTGEGWVHDRVPGPEDGGYGGDVFVPADLGASRLHWAYVVPGQPWKPLRTTTPSPPHRW